MLSCQVHKYHNTRKLALALLCLPLVIIPVLYREIMLSKGSTNLDFTLWNSQNKLDFIEQIHVVSLLYRLSRRNDMEKLRLALGFEWSYNDAIPAEDPLVGAILNWVDWTRASIENRNHTAATEFSWAENIDELAGSSKEFELWNSDVFGAPTKTSSQPITCATGDYDLPDLTPTIPEYLILTAARVACWHSHLSVIHKLANTLKRQGVGLILEDDVDMEKDITQQIQFLWPFLPEDWDIVFLGHCWSDERRGRLLTPNSSGVASSDSRLYTSTSPKCTHAYALSRIGARRLLLHLRYSPFAYSRAIDQALSWLVQSGRLRSFSVVPSLVVQRKIAESDVMVGNGKGSKWKDTLVRGFFNDTD